MLPTKKTKQTKRKQRKKPMETAATAASKKHELPVKTGNGKKAPGELPGMDGPGVERLSIPEIDAAIESYVSARDKRLKFLGEEVDLKDELKKLLRVHKDKIGASDPDGAIIYRHDDLTATLKHGADELTVTKTKKKKPDDEAE